jgi:hypothetical protein
MMQLRRLTAMGVLTISWAMTGTIAPLAHAQTTTESIESAREALSSRGGMPWYDREQDDLRAINVPPKKPGDMSNRKSRWEDASQPKPTTPRQPLNWSFRGGGIAEGILYILVASLILAGGGFLIYILVRAYLLREDAAAVSSDKSFDFGEVDENRIESLPFTVARPRGNLSRASRPFPISPTMSTASIRSAGASPSPGRASG